jgi:hypothetical protein
VSSFDASRLLDPRLTFSKDVPSHSGTNAWNGLNLYGPFDNSRVDLPAKSLLFVFPSELKHLAHKLAAGLKGHKKFRGFQQMFRVPFDGSKMDFLTFKADLSSGAAAAASYREEIVRWGEASRARDPLAAIVLVPKSDRWETERPYYIAKAAFARLGIPTQMVTSDLVENDEQFSWSVGNIALALFAKLGGVPWLIEVPDGDDDLIIGVGRADIPRGDGVERLFGYAMSFASNGYYEQVWAFKPAVTEDEYEQRLREAVAKSLEESYEKMDQAPRRLVLHLGSKTGAREIRAIEAAMKDTGKQASTAFLRLDDSSIYDLADGLAETMAPPKGLAVRLGERRLLLQAEGATALGPPDGPILVELNKKSTVGPEALDELAAQAFRLSHASWRGFNARSKPVTLAYGEFLAQLAGFLEDVDLWDGQLLHNELRNRPWFL